MAGTIKRTNPGDAANIFVRCMLSDISDLLGGFSEEDLDRTVEYFDYKCPYTGEDISVEYKTGKWVLDHLIPHNRKSVGLNLYGNLIVTTKSTNTAKAAKSFEDFIRFGTKGTDEEKEKRIKKIRKFQEESGYFGRVQNVDEIKELCRKEYDLIQKKLKEHLNDYKSIVGMKNDNVESRPKRVFEVNSKQIIGNQQPINHMSFNELKIGEIAKKVLIPVLESGKVSDYVVERLQDLSYSKQFFGINYPLLRKARDKYEAKPKRYYANASLINGNYYFICSEWYEGPANNDRPYLIKWLEDYI